jgi:hypothetical protein
MWPHIFGACHGHNNNTIPVPWWFLRPPPPMICDVISGPLNRWHGGGVAERG